ncbi:MAG TPA: hydroxymethylbilane synthase [Miltoncostaea sp.]|nr:hydroxymethylbilane synthase [Miltoncostaea sp.]
MHLVLATRRSPLARAQTAQVAAALEVAGHTTEALEVVTTGDRWSASGTDPAPDRGLFVKELEEALLDERAHLAVHSAKDLPADLPDGLGVVAVPAREDARDVLVGVPGGIDHLPEGARVGTGSPRRAAQLLDARPDAVVVPVRGNVGTRLEKLARGEYDALVLAAAGLRRLGLEPPGTSPLPVDLSTPAPGQGLLAVEARLDGEAAAAAAAALDDPVAHACLDAERALLDGLGGGCMRPVGAYCEPTHDGLRLVAFAAPEAGPGGERVVLEGVLGDAADLGRRAAVELAGVRR